MELILFDIFIYIKIALMNTGRDLMKRLLHLLPVQKIKDEYELTGNGEDIIEQVTGNQTQIALKNFVLRNFAITRQNINLYELNAPFAHANFNANNFPFSVENPRMENDSFIFHFFSKTVIQVYLSNPVVSDELHFLRPITIKIIGNRLIIHFTKLVKNISHYFPHERLARKVSEQNEEEDILDDVLAFFAAYHPQPLDINVGVKHLWEINDVDCYKIQWRKAFSSATEVMDGTMTFKERYPAEYAQITQTPLVKTVFKYLLNDDYLCKEFTTDPENGQISINQFSQDSNQVNNFVSKILGNN
jgi:hypothetical protein